MELRPVAFIDELPDQVAQDGRSAVSWVMA
jgi:hypothetical protein